MSIERFTNAYSRESGETLKFSDNEVPVGTIDGANLTFTLANIPRTKTLDLMLNYNLLILNTDYTLSSKTLTIDAGSVPLPGDSFLASYRY